MTNTGFMAITTNADVQLLSQVLPSPDRERERKREREREIEREREQSQLQVLAVHAPEASIRLHNGYNRESSGKGGYLLALGSLGFGLLRAFARALV